MEELELHGERLHYRLLPGTGTGPEGAEDMARCAGAATFVAPGNGPPWLEAGPAAEGGGADFGRPAMILLYAAVENIFSRSVISQVWQSQSLSLSSPCTKEILLGRPTCCTYPGTRS